VAALFRRRQRGLPYLLLAPGLLWLGVFFIVPLGFLAYQSLQSGSIDFGYAFTWAWGNYWHALRDYRSQFVRSLEYAGMATVIALVVSYPVAYWIAFHGGKRKTTYLFLLLLPFFVSFVIRTLAWEWILSDNGILFGTLKRWHLLPQSFHVLSTPTAVISGIAYNFLPFMALPLYVSLEKIDRRVVEAARDLSRELVNTPDAGQWGHRAVGEVFLAMEKPHRADERFRAGADPAGRARAWLMLGDPARALDLLREAKAVFAGLSGIDPYNEARAGIALAGAHLQIGDLPGAEAAAVEAADRMQQLDSQFERAEALCLLGEIAQRRGDGAAAGRHYRTALDAFTHLGSTRAEQVRTRLAGLL